MLKNVVFKGSFRGLFCFGFGGGVPPFNLPKSKRDGAREKERAKRAEKQAGQGIESEKD